MNANDLFAIVGYVVLAVWAAGFGMLLIELVDMARQALDKRRARK